MWKIRFVSALPKIAIFTSFALAIVLPLSGGYGCGTEGDVCRL
ncbi:MAG TPA: hypothetical protein VGS11_03565 [Candidatus Bathyarchaeia archaeon]|nr:hypothetical protein [Candidatus Bathyarchaeia archaeon]